MRLHDGFFGNRSQMASLAGLRFSYGVYQGHTRLPRHSHSQPYLCLVAAGAFEERACRRVEHCSAGTVVWNPSGDEHDDRFGSGGARIWNLEFTEAWNDRLAQATREWTVRRIEAAWLVRRIFQEIADPDSASALSLEGLVCALIGEVSHQRRATDRRGPSWVWEAQDRLRAEYRTPPSVGELAHQAGVHRSHFARAFRRFTGCTVADFVRRARIEWATARLRDQQHTLSELSLEAGFGDQAHFTRAFKRMTGLTPGEYRAAMR